MRAGQEDLEVLAGQRLTAGNRETLPGSDTMLEINPVAGGYPQQIGRAPNHIVLELAHLAVGINKFPHHLDDAQATTLIHRTHDHAREMIEVDRLTFDQRCGCDQFVGGSGIEPEAAFDQAMQLAFFDLGRFAVERDDVDKQGGGGQNITGIVEITRLAPGRNDIGDELTQSVEHEGSLIGFEGYMARNNKLRNRRALSASITFRQFSSFRDAPHGAGPEPMVPLKSRRNGLRTRSLHSRQGMTNSETTKSFSLNLVDQNLVGDPAQRRLFLDGPDLLLSQDGRDLRRIDHAAGDVNGLGGCKALNAGGDIDGLAEIILTFVQHDRKTGSLVNADLDDQIVRSEEHT